MFTLREMMVEDVRATEWQRAFEDQVPSAPRCSRLRRAWILFHGNVKIAEITDYDMFMNAVRDGMQPKVRVYPLDLSKEDYFGAEDASRPQES